MECVFRGGVVTGDITLRRVPGSFRADRVPGTGSPRRPATFDHSPGTHQGLTLVMLISAILYRCNLLRGAARGVNETYLPSLTHVLAPPPPSRLPPTPFPESSTSIITVLFISDLSFSFTTHCCIDRPPQKKKSKKNRDNHS